MREDQTQLFKMEYGTRCDTFGCGETGAYMVGRPAGPLNTNHVLCQSCTDTLAISITELKLEPPIVVGYDLRDVEPEVVEFDPREVVAETDIKDAPGYAESLVEEAKTHAELDEFAKNFGLKGIPSRDKAKLQERKEAILAALAE